MSDVDSVERVAALLRSAAEDLERLNQAVPGQEGSRATQNVRASLDAMRRELIGILAGSGLDVTPLLDVEAPAAFTAEDAIPQTAR